MGNHKTDQKPKASHEHSDYNSLRYSWRRAFVGDNGPQCSTCRHLLHTLNHHMNNNGRCWPSIKTLARETWFDERTVRRHLGDLDKGGWINRGLGPPNGKGWRCHRYHIAFPDRAGTAPAPSNQRAGPHAQGAGSDAVRAGNESNMVRAQDPTNLLGNLLKNLKGNGRFDNDEEEKKGPNEDVMPDQQTQKEVTNVPPRPSDKLDFGSESEWEGYAKLLSITPTVTLENARDHIRRWVDQYGMERVCSIFQSVQSAQPSDVLELVTTSLKQGRSLNNRQPLVSNNVPNP